MAEYRVLPCGRSRHRPWQLHVVIEFQDEQRAVRFERYLKSGWT